MGHHLFIDEVGNGDLSGAAYDANIRYLSLTGIITSRRGYDLHIVPTFRAFKAVFFSEPVVLHRREIMRREGPFNILRDEKTRENFDSALLLWITALPYIAITVTIDKKKHLEKYSAWHYDPYHYCLRCLVERYVLWLDRHNSVGDVTIEARFKLADKKTKASFWRIFDSGTEHLPSNKIQKRLTSRDIKLEPKSTNNAALQLCDIIAHPSYRSMKMRRDGVVEPDDFGTKIVAALRQRHYARNPQTKVIDGWGIKWLP